MSLPSLVKKRLTPHLIISGYAAVLFFCGHPGIAAPTSGYVSHTVTPTDKSNLTEGKPYTERVWFQGQNKREDFVVNDLVAWSRAEGEKSWAAWPAAGRIKPLTPSETETYPQELQYRFKDMTAHGTQIGEITANGSHFWKYAVRFIPGADSDNTEHTSVYWVLADNEFPYSLPAPANPNQASVDIRPGMPIDSSIFAPPPGLKPIRFFQWTATRFTLVAETTITYPDNTIVRRDVDTFRGDGSTVTHVRLTSYSGRPDHNGPGGIETESWPAKKSSDWLWPYFAAPEWELIKKTGTSTLLGMSTDELAPNLKGPTLSDRYPYQAVVEQASVADHPSLGTISLRTRKRYFNRTEERRITRLEIDS